MITLKVSLRTCFCAMQNQGSASKKRKREPTKSMSLLSISQPPLTKKFKTKRNIDENTSISRPDQVYRTASYLKRSLRQFIQTLRRQISHPLKLKSEQKFVCKRLKLFDQHYVLNLYQCLWQSYLDDGSEHGQWPVNRSLFFKIENIIKLLFLFPRINSLKWPTQRILNSVKNLYKTI